MNTNFFGTMELEGAWTSSKYSYGDLLAKWKAWSSAEPGSRQGEWDDYCDVRDDKDPGQSRDFRLSGRAQESVYQFSKKINEILTRG